jgi:penicillin-binding protein A
VNHALRRISLGCLIMFVLLLINVNYLQGFQANSLAGEKGNVRSFDQAYQYQRGSISTADGVVIAKSRPVKGIYKFQRYYPHGPVYAPVTGYNALYGSTGIEQAENKLLSGTDPTLTVRNLIDLITGKQKQGANVQLTINSKAQQAAYAGLKQNGKSGAVVALNPKTGAILALASYPSFNPNAYATLDGAKLNKVDARYRKDPSQPLLNRAINATYPPGSTFKIVTSSTAFGTGRYTMNSVVDAPPSLSFSDSNKTLVNANGELCGDGHVPLIFAFTLSCNTAFGHLGDQLGSPALKRQADKYGFNHTGLTIPMRVSPSNFPLVTGQALTAYSAIGQFDDTVTPMQEALLAATVANRGRLMKPYLVQDVKAPDLTTVQKAKPAKLSQPVSAKNAAQLKQMMLSVVNSPSGTAYVVPGIHESGLKIAAKTGTAQNGRNNTGLNDAVFTALAPADNPSIAIGVIIKGGGYGAAAAGPIAVQVIKAYLSSQGQQ